MGQPEARLSDAAMALLTKQRWPGNARELENVIQRGLLLCNGRLIEPNDMSLDSTYTSQIYGLPTLSVPAPLTHWNQHNNRDSCESENNVPSEISSIRDGGPLEEVTALPSDVRDLEREHILSVLKRVNGHRKKAVEILGISERTLRYKLKQWREAGYLIP